MLTITEAHTIVSQHLTIDPGKFYGNSAQLSLGVGKLYSGVRFPKYDESDQIFDTVEGLVYVASHECDTAQENVRAFNSYVLICPVIEFSNFLHDYQAASPCAALRQFLASLARREISRVTYIPHIAASLPYGGLLYFNQMTNTHVSAFTLGEARAIGAVSTYGLQIIDQSLQEHLFRPKSEPLSIR